MVVEIDQTAYKDLILLILQFLAEENCKSALHSLERESKVFFNVRYFLDTVEHGEWDEAEKYLSAFTNRDDNIHSANLFHKLHTCRYYETLARESEQEKRNVIAASAPLLNEFFLLIMQNPLFQNKLAFPILNQSGLLSILNLIWLNPQKDARMLKEALIFMILQFLDEQNFYETRLWLEQETKVFFNMKQFEKFLLNGEWDNAEKYISAFTSPGDNWHSLMTFYEIIKQKFFATMKVNEHVYWYACGRARASNILKSLVKENQFLQDKLKFQCMDESRLLAIVKQCMDWWVPHGKSAKLACNEAISLGGIPKVQCLFHAQSPLTNMFCDATSVVFNHGTIHLNPPELQLHVLEADHMMLSLLENRGSGETFPSHDCSEVIPFGGLIK